MKFSVPSNGIITPPARKSSARIFSFSNSARHACGKSRPDPNFACEETPHAGKNYELSPWFRERAAGEASCRPRPRRLPVDRLTI
jgi:hypothetical protein